MRQQLRICPIDFQCKCIIVNFFLFFSCTRKAHMLMSNPPKNIKAIMIKSEVSSFCYKETTETTAVTHSIDWMPLALTAG